MGSGERFEPHNSNFVDVSVNLERYLFALNCLKDKIVCEIGFGSGLSTYLFSLVANYVYAYDYSDEALKMAQLYPKRENVLFIKQDLEKVHRLKECEIIVALEFLEHLTDPVSFLKDQTARTIIFSVPTNSLTKSTWHKYQIIGETDTRNMFIDGGYKVERIFMQDVHWLYGIANKFN